MFCVYLMIINQTFVKILKKEKIMREMLKNKILVLSVSGIIIAALAFCTVMVAKATMADTENYIGKEKAKELALADAGVKITDVTFTKSKLDKEDAVIVYEIEFYTNTAEYDYEIEATAGTIFSKEIEKIKKAKTETNNTSDEDKNVSNYIGVDKAKSIALSSAGISDVTFTKAKLDYDDGIAVYEIEFYTNTAEYDYEISATTGKVRSKDVDKDDDNDNDDDNDDDYDNDDEDDDNDDEDHD